MVPEVRGEALQSTAWPPLRATGQCRGTFGELMQGVLPGGRHFLVTLPVNLMSIVEFQVTDGPAVVCNIACRTKACRAAQDYLRLHDLPPGGRLHFQSVFPAGKGLASSSADMVAVIRATARAHGREAGAGTIESILRGIEPTDGVMYDGIVSFYHREVKLDEQLGETPELMIVGTDRGGECDTIEFNRTRCAVSSALCSEYHALLDDMKSAARAADLRRIGEVATRSCEISQAFNPHPHIGHLRALKEETGALGMVAAHSGTYIGLLYGARDPECAAKAFHAQKRLQALDISTHLYTTA